MDREPQILWPRRIVDEPRDEGRRAARAAERLRTVIAAPMPRGRRARAFDPIAAESVRAARVRARVRRLGYALVLVSGVAAAVTATRIVATRTPDEPVRHVAAAAPRIGLPLVEPEVSPPAPVERPTEAAPRVAVRRVGARHPEPPATSALATETAILERALAALRQDHDAAAALAALDEHEKAFPRGALGHEADATKVEALLELGREVPALRVLDAMTFGGSRRDLGLRLNRATLRAAAGRCLDAEADYARVLHAVTAGPLAEHALYGRASCRTRRADWAGARADLERYVQQFPSGTFAAEARRALERL
jgi:hypothetical protein